MVKVKSFPGTLKSVAWGQPIEVYFDGAKKPEMVVSGVTGTPKDFIKDYEKVTERKILKISSILTAEEIEEDED